MTDSAYSQTGFTHYRRVRRLCQSLNSLDVSTSQYPVTSDDLPLDMRTYTDLQSETTVEFVHLHGFVNIEATFTSLHAVTQLYTFESCAHLVLCVSPPSRKIDQHDVRGVSFNTLPPLAWAPTYQISHAAEKAHQSVIICHENEPV